MYSLSRKADDSVDAFAHHLGKELPPRLLNCGVLRLAVAVNDGDVAPAEQLRIGRREPAIDAVVSLWVRSSNDMTAVEAALASCADIVGGFLVTESEALPGRECVGQGARTTGMLQVAFLQIPDGMEADTWFSLWRDEHSPLAIETQSTFIYRQNLVVRSLVAKSPGFAAIVEEAFPAEAMTSQHAFYDAIGDDVKLERHRNRMWRSSKRFIDLASIEVVPMSEYTWSNTGSD